MPTVILSGTIKKINPSEVKGTFEKRIFHLGEEKDKYPSVWSLEAHQAFCNELDKYSVGDKIECHVDISGREWNDKAFNTLKCYRINKLQAAEKAPEPAYQPDLVEPLDDLPF